MKHDYLWDKAGPSDPEIARLEQTLGTLRRPANRPAWLKEFAANQQPAPAVRHPAPLTPRRRWWHLFQMPQLAIAASVTVCVLAGALWFGLSRRNQPASLPASVAKNMTPVSAAPSRPEEKLVAEAPASGKAATPRAAVLHRTPVARVLPARMVVAPVRVVRTAPQPRPAPEAEFTPEEARKAQADLALALAVINDKLNRAQKGAEGHTLRIPELAGETR